MCQGALTAVERRSSRWRSHRPIWFQLPKPGRVLCVLGGGTVHGLWVAGRTRPLAQPIALAGHLNDGRVREEAIEGRRCGRDVAEEDAPVRVGQFVVINVEPVS
jgi:hypothetical protein